MVHRKKPKLPFETGHLKKSGPNPFAEMQLKKKPRQIFKKNEIQFHKKMWFLVHCIQVNDSVYGWGLIMMKNQFRTSFY